MYADSISALGDQAAAKLTHQRNSLLGHFVRSMLAGMYVGACIVLIFTVGGSISIASPAYVKLLMGVCFGGALTMVIFAGSELFTGSNLVLTLGVLTKKTSSRDLASNWVWTWLGNLLGSVLLAVIVVRSGVLSAEPIRSFVLKIVEAKMNIPPEQLLWRAALANWLVCLGVWMAARAKSEPAKMLLIWWCMFTFITCAYEHSVANMCGLMLGLLLPHGDFAGITWGGYAYNIALATLGNILGGAGFVAGMYWVGCRAPAKPAPVEPQPVLAASGSGMNPAVAYAPDPR
jgi:nitrite transporter NirC